MKHETDKKSDVLETTKLPNPIPLGSGIVIILIKEVVANSH